VTPKKPEELREQLERQNEDQPAEEDEPREKSRKGMDVRTPTRDEFFANLEQVSRPDDEDNGEKAK
jgi:hypothetical protein